MRVPMIVGSVVAGLLLVAAAASAQQVSSGIAGMVRDASGAVLPGVTVEAGSPALIEKVRTVITDGEGRYSIVDLRLGTYTVTFTLTGFSTLRREGIVLTAGFTATVNAELKVGALEETVTVTGASPIVDTQSARQQVVISNDLLSALPTGAKSVGSIATLIPGMANQGSDSTGGATGLYASHQIHNIVVHGHGGTRVLYDGMDTQNLVSAGATSLAPNPATVAETTVETGGISAESNNSGISFNMVPKEGSNVVKGGGSVTYTNNHLQAENLPADLAARGFQTTSDILRFYDAQFYVGGPIKQDRVWFLVAARTMENKNLVPGIYFNKTRGTPFYTPDLSRPAFRQEWDKSLAGRVTWQVSPRNKVSGFAEPESFQVRGQGGLAAPEAQGGWSIWPNTGIYQGSWTATVTSKLLLQAGAGVARGGYERDREYLTDIYGFVVEPTDISILEASTGFRYNAAAPGNVYRVRNIANRYVERFSMSYVTGSHTFKAGFQQQQIIDDLTLISNQDQDWVFNQGRPSQITQWATPYQTRERINPDLGLFAQDQWTIKRLTANYGLRFDWYNGYNLAEDGSLPKDRSGKQVSPGLFVPVRTFPRVDNAPNFKDLGPRLGASYDLFGTGRTALKASLGRYVAKAAMQITNSLHPVLSSVNSVTRVWTDTNGDYVPDCDLKNFTANGECLAISNSNFGSTNPNAVTYGDDLIRGFGKRDYIWDFATEVQQQLGSRVSLAVGYDHNWSDHFGSLVSPQGWPTGVSHNLSLTPADFTQYCVTAPRDQGLPGGGGYQVCGLYDVDPAKFGQGQIQWDRASHFGGKSRVNDFFTVALTARLGAGRAFSGSIDTGRSVEDSCFVADTPQQLLNCRVVTPFKAQTLIKVNGSYPLPAGFLVSGVFQNLSGATYSANWAVPNDLIAPSLGRNLAQCGTRAVCTATAQVPLVPPQTLFQPRRTILDVRVSKVLRLGSSRTLRANVDVFNIPNRSDLQGVVSTYGPSWGLPNAGSSGSILGGRSVQLGGELSF